MASLAIDPVTRPRPLAIGHWLTAYPALAAMLATLTLVAMNPIGFIGGGGDEYQYLIAARCTASHGFCLPHDHWWRRWPVVLPTAAMLRLFGESYLSIALVPLGYALASVALLATMVTRVAGRAAGTVAGIAFAVTPIVSDMTLEIGVDMPEFLLTLATVGIVQRGWAQRDGGQRGWRKAALAGLMAGLAIQARPTALTLVPLFVLFFAGTRRWRWVAAFVAAAALPSLAEALVYAWTAGDPLLGWKLSLAHVRVPTTELLPGVDTAQSPLFNPAYIGGWRRPMDIHVHWTVDGALNYLFHPAVAVTIMAALILLVLDWRGAVRDHAAPQLLLAALLGAAWFGALTYGFAIDPKPRMFLPVLAVAAALFGVLAVRRWRASPAVVAVIGALIVGKGLIAAYERFGMMPFAAAAPGVIASGGPGLTIEPRTARFLTLVPAARALPLSTGPADRRAVLILGQASCANAAAEEGYAPRRERGRFTETLREPEPIPTLRAHKLFFSPAITPVLCALAAR